MLAHQVRCHRCPHVAGIAEPVQHDNSGSITTNADVDRRAISFNLFVMKS